MEPICNCYCGCDISLYRPNDVICILCVEGDHEESYSSNDDDFDFIELGGES